MGSGVTKEKEFLCEKNLEENELADPAKLYVKLFKGSPATNPKNMYDIGYKLGEIASKNNTKYAIKEVYTLDLSPKQLLELSMEINLLSQLHHKNIVHLYEVFKTGSHMYLVTEYLSGGELFDAICQQEFYSEGDARRVMHSILSAVSYCHQHGVMHRDLKPENLILIDNTSETDIKLIDFGFACAFGDNVPKETQLCGTPGYVAPEMLDGVEYSCEVDMWSVGVIMYVLLAGMPPFYTKDVDKLYDAIKNAKFSYPVEFWAEISNGAKDMINKLLVVDVRKRLTVKQALQHAWILDKSVEANTRKQAISFLRLLTNRSSRYISFCLPHLRYRDISKSLEKMREWNAGRRIKASGLAVKSCIKFSLAGKRYKQTFLNAAARARDLETKGIHWFQSPAEIEQAEKLLHGNANHLTNTSSMNSQSSNTTQDGVVAEPPSSQPAAPATATTAMKGPRLSRIGK